MVLQTYIPKLGAFCVFFLYYSLKKEVGHHYTPEGSLTDGTIEATGYLCRIPLANEDQSPKEKNKFTLF